MATLLVISLSDLANDPRVDRQIDFLRGSHRVIAAGLGPPAYEDVEYVPLEDGGRPGLVHRLKGGLALLLRVAGAHRMAYWSEPDHRRWRSTLAELEPDLIISNDAWTLPLAFSIAEGRPVVFDAHEYAPVEFETSFMWRVLARRHVRWICRNYLPRTRGMMAVAQGIADRYQREAGVPVTVVTNAPRFEPLDPREAGEMIRLVHFGWPDPQRRLGDTVAAMDLLGEGYSLDLFLVCPEALRRQLEELKRRAADNPRIRFLDPVPMREIPRIANEYDIGVHMLPPATFNQEHALPNKFFEYIQARIAPAIGPSPEMARMAHEWDFGIVADDYTPEALASAIASPSRERLSELKRNADRAARELCAERNRDLVLEVVNRALGRPAPVGSLDLSA